jgi:tRNA-2-methylthio-N6-dimethylallyladenosine synthase
MNVYDGERMAELLAAQGMTPADARDDADLVVLNTCHIREKATKRSIRTSAACGARTVPRR